MLFIPGDRTTAENLRDCATLKLRLSADDNPMVYDTGRNGSVDTKRVYQSRNTGPIGVFLAVMFALFLIPGVQFLHGSPRHPSEPIEAASALIIGIVGIAWSLVFMARMGVRVTDEGIVVSNWFRRYSIPWSRVESFRFGDELRDLSVREQMASPMLQTYVVFTDNHHLVMTGLQATRLPRSRKKVQDLLDELEVVRRQHLGPTTNGAPAGSAD